MNEKTTVAIKVVEVTAQLTSVVIEADTYEYSLS